MANDLHLNQWATNSPQVASTLPAYFDDDFGTGAPSQVDISVKEELSPGPMKSEMPLMPYDATCLIDNTFDMCGKDLLPAPNSPVNFGYSGGSPGRYISSPGRGGYSTLLNSPGRSPGRLAARSPGRYGSSRQHAPGSPLRNIGSLHSPSRADLQNSPLCAAGGSLSSYSFSLKVPFLELCSFVVRCLALRVHRWRLWHAGLAGPQP